VDIPAELLTLLDAVAARIEHALERAAGLEHLRQTREAALRAMGRVIEGRDGETFGHTDRVTILAVRLGEALGLDAASIQHLRWGAYLHDIGKVTVPDAILLKPGPLTPDERQLMQQHAVTGDDLLRDESFVPREVRAVVRSHHERWDGTGYPDGQRDTQIPLLARIFSVADVYDALVSERPYKRAWPHDAAVAELRRSAGTQFDPGIVEAFVALCGCGGGPS
jgi:putative nucleotidyltransferase with HDIG domain